jgi:hypothetical protein
MDDDFWLFFILILGGLYWFFFIKDKADGLTAFQELLWNIGLGKLTGLKARPSAPPPNYDENGCPLYEKDTSFADKMVLSEGWYAAPVRGLGWLFGGCSGPKS